MKFCIVTWMDAAEPNPDEVTAVNDLNLAPIPVFSSGYIVEENKEFITLARDFFQGNPIFSNAVRRCLSIPKRSIIKITRIHAQELKI